MGEQAKTVHRCQEVQVRTWCSSKAASSLLPANPSSTFHRDPATFTSWANDGASGSSVGPADHMPILEPSIVSLAGGGLSIRGAL